MKDDKKEIGKVIRIRESMVSGPPPARVRPPRGLEFLDAATLASPLPPKKWLCEGLGLAAGAPTGIAGYAYSGKTMVMQSFALSVASGKRAWGVYQTRRGRCVHIDYEQGREQTIDRYQRLARGQGVDLAELVRKDLLRVSILPPLYLNDNDAEDVFARAIDGAAFVLIDSLRAAIPGADENDSSVRRYLDLLGRVSERTGAVISMILHQKKPNSDGSGSGDMKHTVRGSSGIFDACASMFVLEGKKGEPTIVHHEKDRARGRTLDDFALAVEDVDPAGLRVRHVDLAQLDEGADGAKKVKMAQMRVLEFLKKQPGGAFNGDRRALRMVMGMQYSSLVAAITMLEGGGEVICDTKPARIRLAPPPAPPVPVEEPEGKEPKTRH